MAKERKQNKFKKKKKSVIISAEGQSTINSVSTLTCFTAGGNKECHTIF